MPVYLRYGSSFYFLNYTGSTHTFQTHGANRLHDLRVRYSHKLLQYLKPTLV